MDLWVADLMISDNTSTYEAVAGELKDLFTSEAITTINQQGTNGNSYQGRFHGLVVSGSIC